MSNNFIKNLKNYRDRSENEKKPEPIEWTHPIRNGNPINGSSRISKQNNKSVKSIGIDDKKINRARQKVLKEIKQTEEQDNLITKKTFTDNSKKISDKEALKAQEKIISSEQKIRKEGKQNIVFQNNKIILLFKKIRYFFRQKEKDRNVFDINLAKEEVTIFIDWQENINFLITCLLVPVFVIGFLYAGLIFWQTQKISRNSMYVGEIAELRQKQIEAERGIEDIITFQKKLKIAQDLLDKHIYWTNFFEFLEKNTLRDVYYSGISGNTDGVYTFDAKGNDFSSITEQVKVFRNNSYVKEVSVNAGNISSSYKKIEDDNGQLPKNSKVGFNINLVLDKAIFFNKYGKKN